MDMLRAAAESLDTSDILTLFGFAKIMHLGREARMIARFGESCSKSAAGRILDKSPSSINTMLKDGRLSPASGNMVDVRSVARYIAQPRQMDFDAHVNRMKQAHGSDWHV